MTATFRRQQRLLTPAQYQAVFKRRLSVHTDTFGVYICPNSLESARLGLVVSKKVSKRAVDRNRIKRLAREAFRHHAIAQPCIDIVVVAKKPCIALDGPTLLDCLDKLWIKALSKHQKNKSRN